MNYLKEQFGEDYVDVYLGVDNYNDGTSSAQRIMIMLAGENIDTKQGSTTELSEMAWDMGEVHPDNSGAGIKNKSEENKQKPESKGE